MSESFIIFSGIGTTSWWLNVAYIGLIIAICILFAVGMYFIITEFTVSPTRKARKAVLLIKKEKLSLANQLIIPIANHIVKFIKISPQRRALLQKKLYAAEINYTPDFYIARALATSVLVVIMGIASCVVTPFLFFVCVLLAVAVYFRGYQEADYVIKEKSVKIQGELVLFASTIQTQIATTHDIIKIFESYRKICGDVMSHELDITLSDMKTGSYETALRRFESRLQSQSLSEIIRGLLAVLRGDDQKSYFDMLVHDLTIRERERLKREANDRPKKIRVYSFLVLGAIVLIFSYVIGYQIIDELQVML